MSEYTHEDAMADLDGLRRYFYGEPPEMGGVMVGTRGGARTYRLGAYSAALEAENAALKAERGDALEALRDALRIPGLERAAEREAQPCDDCYDENGGGCKYPAPSPCDIRAAFTYPGREVDSILERIYAVVRGKR